VPEGDVGVDEAARILGRSSRQVAGCEEVTPALLMAG
jgi:hypothetical protein